MFFTPESLSEWPFSDRLEDGSEEARAGGAHTPVDHRGGMADRFDPGEVFRTSAAERRYRFGGRRW